MSDRCDLARDEIEALLALSTEATELLARLERTHDADALEGALAAAAEIAVPLWDAHHPVVYLDDAVRVLEAVRDELVERVRRAEVAALARWNAAVKASEGGL